MKGTKGFSIFMGKGFAMTFQNGHTVSVQFGPMNYCEHYDKPFEAKNYFEAGQVAKDGGEWDSTDAEVASWGPDGEWTTRGFFPDNNDDVKGRVSPDEVQKFMAWVASRPAATEAK
jgi:hypothetical protein